MRSVSPERPQRRKGSQSEKAAPDTRSTSPDKKSSKTPDRTSPTKTTRPSSPEKSSRRGSVEKLSASMKDHSSPSTEGKQRPPSKGEPMSKYRPSPRPPLLRMPDVTEEQLKSLKQLFRAYREAIKKTNNPQVKERSPVRPVWR
ncbi:hypothetical protein Pcinc_010959 [Petrolisthes cinctipes]|uniref:Uncharacterized protein n=1 Tax=Petrolisthes cinctipes TaxID=88211 RepID=A0AAE1G1R3_PETCI|nr:hypothetical protein Pcinc_010959 [Petrolisthes cinctipes]